MGCRFVSGDALGKRKIHVEVLEEVKEGLDCFFRGVEVAVVFYFL